MQKIIIFAAILNLITMFSHAQKRDRVWVFGDSIGVDFNNLSNPVPIHTSSSYTDENNASVSDQEGNLQFYLGGLADTTGFIWSMRMRIFNKNGELMENGDSINSDYSETNGLMIIPFPYDSNKYYVFHLAHVSYQSQLYYSVIDMSYNNGLGKVISKNIALPITANDSLCEKLAAAKHGNGKDWWLICHKYKGYSYYEFLINSTGITGPFIKNEGSCFCGDLNMWGEMCFSNDGSKLLNVSVNIVDVMNFDRCSGSITTFAQLGDSINPVYPLYYGCSFSPSGRFIYVSNIKDLYFNNNKLYQLDINAADILQSKFLVYEGPIGNYDALIGQHQIGPDNKIYISFSKGAPFYPSIADSTNLNLSVIENPDSDGTSCKFSSFSFYLDGRMTGFGLPNMPSYNLGAIKGSECDTIFNSINQFKPTLDFKIFPNPTTNNFTLTTSSIGHLTIINSLSQTIQSLTINNTQQQISTSTFPSGIYFLTFQTDKTIQTKKLLIQH